MPRAGLPAEPGRDDGARWTLPAAQGVVVAGPDQGLRFPISGEPITLGSARDCGVILNDGSVSRRHLELSLVGAAVRLRDLGSANGSYVDSARVALSLVPTGAVVRLGRSAIHLRGADEQLVLKPSGREHFGDLYGGSPAMRLLYAALERLAPRDTPVLIDGEAGTGKELAARALHEDSDRAEGPFLIFDCAASERIEAQLFGHRRGAIPGVHGERPGVFEAADGGTVFLDALDALPGELQPKLLRVLERLEVVRVGELNPRPVDVRVIAATGRSPEALVSAGALRRDLYLRLAAARVTMPALRERIEDLPTLCSILLVRLGAAHLAVEEGPALARLREHPWPGNVRELREALERALTRAPDDALSLDALPIGVARAEPPPIAELPFHAAKAQAQARWEREYLGAALARSGGDLGAMARALELTREELRALLVRHGLRGEG